MKRFFPPKSVKQYSVLALAALGLCAGLANAQEKREWGKWDRWGDLGNGTYLNPVIPADYSEVNDIRAV